MTQPDMGQIKGTNRGTRDTAFPHPTSHPIFSLYSSPWTPVVNNVQGI